MTIDEIFATITNNMLQGIMMHDELCKTCRFLRLKKFAKQQYERFLEENKKYQFVNKYFIRNKNRLIKYLPVNPSSYIPVEWFDKTRFDVTPDDIRKATMYILSTWITWEEHSKDLYSKCYMDAMNLGYADDLKLLGTIVEEVRKELEEATQLNLLLNGMNFDPIEIMDMNE